MTTAAVILAGGRGTRSANPRSPKIAQVIGGKSLLQWHLDLLQASSISDVVLVSGYLADQVDQLVESSNAGRLRLTTVREQDPRGTVQAVREATKTTEASHLLVILGDIWCSFPIDDFVCSWQQARSPVAAIVHPSLHPGDSDAVIPQPSGRVDVIPKAQREGLHRNMSATGIFGVSRDFLSTVDQVQDLGSDLIFRAANSDQLHAFISSHYFKDTGTPDRLASAQRDWESGAFQRRGQLTPRPALILDRDGVLNPALPEVYRADQLELIPGVAQQIARANTLGVPVVVATNQPGLAKGFMEVEHHEQIRARLDQLLIDQGAFIDDYSYCPHHPESGHQGEVAELKIQCACRKPEPGLLLELIARHGLDAAASVMVGDSDRDLMAATSAQAGFIRVDGELPSPAAIAEAVDRLTC
jgi:histidinol-phosphate phosphatase family protein